ncbi:oligopeptide/dipeptide ABC transporter, ATPase subunit [Ancylobacter novellus DSM 506]|uniref:Oligopeptide/dipeptide ABC transporter, ATPase subunit n=1 Tax=Ancylobacter novellus (strain ATCC 8093 / DSM 506 / JCM 20403 / CCM 1077 / IAM 12100 / NBRC 12443 / NCIMB 10456) TaxID=639283 RepID=D7AAA5_ANCN5|nr:ABC transporter ATP-binding protein [Ancylobacter novellus]ADH90892.1 oligopeptide/dipeptide ABC transporter, ATPase subunit [Ancylobacter novellus DSM 506]
MTALLSVRNLRVEIAARHRVLTAIDDVSFDIAEGEILGVVGESGAGKSVTGTAVLGLLERPAYQAGGEILFGGRRIDTLGEDAMRGLRGKEIAAVFQDPLTSLDPLMSIGEQLVETMQTHLDLSHVEALARAERLLAEVGIPAPRERLQSYPHEMSGGMRQRVVLALAFCCEPRLIIADEPTTALDVSIQAQILDLLRRMCRERGTAVMLVTHDMGVIAEATDRVAVMYAGRLVEIGPTESLIAAAAHPYTRGLMASIPDMHRREAELTQIPGSMPRPDAPVPGCAFHPRCPQALARCATERPATFTRSASQVACWLAARSAA